MTSGNNITSKRVNSRWYIVLNPLVPKDDKSLHSAMLWKRYNDYSHWQIICKVMGRIFKSWSFAEYNGHVIQVPKGQDIFFKILMTSHAIRTVPQTPAASLTCTQTKFEGPGGIFQTVKNSSTGVITMLLQLHLNWIWPEKQGQERLYDKMMWHHYCTFIYPLMIVRAVNSGANRK